MTFPVFFDVCKKVTMYNTKFSVRPVMHLFFISMLVIIIACKKNKGEQSNLPALGTCRPVDAKVGLQSLGDGIYEYNSAGGVTFKMHRTAEMVTITMTDASYPNYITYQLWGKSSTGSLHSALHENLNGKHIKNRIGNNRTIFFPDGTKITCVSTGAEQPVTAVSIYDGAAVHHINITCDKVEYSTADAEMAKRLDELQPDGETSTYDLTPTGLLFYNIYTEDTPGNKVYQRLNLGDLYLSSPNQVSDLYDDPRLGHT